MSLVRYIFVTPSIMLRFLFPHEPVILYIGFAHIVKVWIMPFVLTLPCSVFIASYGLSCSAQSRERRWISKTVCVTFRNWNFLDSERLWFLSSKAENAQAAKAAQAVKPPELKGLIIKTPPIDIVITPESRRDHEEEGELDSHEELDYH